MSWHHTRQCIESVAPRQFSLVHMSRTMCKMTNSTHQTTVSSRPLFSFGFFSCSFLHPCSAINPFQPTPHLLSVNQFPLQNIARVHPRRPSGLANSSFEYRWTGSSPKPCCMVVPHVLFVDDESRGDCICQFACFFFQAVELLFHNFWCF